MSENNENNDISNWSNFFKIIDDSDIPQDFLKERDGNIIESDKNLFLTADENMINIKNTIRKNRSIIAKDYRSLAIICIGIGLAMLIFNTNDSATFIQQFLVPAIGSLLYLIGVLLDDNF